MAIESRIIDGPNQNILRQRPEKLKFDYREEHKVLTEHGSNSNSMIVS